MNTDTLFCHLSSGNISDLIRAAKSSVCYVSPGIQLGPALALFEVAQRIGSEMLTVSMDFDERVMRMGYGDIESVKMLREAGIIINHAPGLRISLIIVDGEGHTFTPTPLYLEAESNNNSASNAMRLSQEQVAESLARLSPAAKAIAIVQAKGPEEKARITNLPLEVGSVQIDETQFIQVDNNLKEAPPVKFDLARQVRVFEPYLQYVELSLTGAALHRYRITIPANIQKLGSGKDLEGRLHTTFNLIQKGGTLSSKPLENALNEIRKNFTPSLGKDHGRVILKSAKPIFLKRLEEFRKKLKAHKKKISDELQKHLDESRQTIIDYYLPRVIETPPDALLGQSLKAEPVEDDARKWLNSELDRVFPIAKSFIQDMKLEKRFKNVTYETLNRDDFVESVKKAFPAVDWEKAYYEFRAAGQSSSEEITK